MDSRIERSVSFYSTPKESCCCSSEPPRRSPSLTTGQILFVRIHCTLRKQVGGGDGGCVVEEGGSDRHGPQSMDN
jgi:hypothetical protein